MIVYMIVIPLMLLLHLSVHYFIKITGLAHRKNHYTINADVLKTITNPVFETNNNEFIPHPLINKVHPFVKYVPLSYIGKC